MVVDYEKCKNCNYYGEINECMYGEDDIPNDLGRYCEGEPKLIRNWNELAVIEHMSDTHILSNVDTKYHSAYIVSKDKHGTDYYISNNASCEEITEILQKCGFNVIVNFNYKENINMKNKQFTVGDILDKASNTVDIEVRNEPKLYNRVINILVSNGFTVTIEPISENNKNSNYPYMYYRLIRIIANKINTTL